MKKLLYPIAIIAALMSCSCSKDENGKGKDSGFSKAEIVFEVTSYDGKGAASADFWDQVSFSISGHDFQGKAIDATVNKDNPTWKITCTEAPTKDKEFTPDVTIRTNRSSKKQDSYSIDCNMSVRAIIYDGAGKAFNSGTAASFKCTGTEPLTQNQLEAQLKDIFQKPFLNKDFYLCYVKNGMTGEWMYNFGWYEHK